jgi:hypothetical protein
MAVTRRFGEKPLQVVAEPELRERIEKVADDEGVSMASVIRDILWAGIDDREQKEASDGS